MFERIKYMIRSVISTLSNPQRWLVEMFGGAESRAGARVNVDTAVKVTAVFACVRILAMLLASLPLHTYRRITGGKELATDHPLYFVLHSMFNPQCTSYMGRLIMMVNLLLTGRAHAEIVRNGASDIIELWPIPSNKVSIRMNPRTNEPFYEVYLDNGGTKVLYPEQMFHLQWIGLENFDTFDPIILAREAIGLSIAAEEFGSKFFANGANASGIAEYPGKLSDEAYNRFTKTFNEKYAGLSKAQRVIFLEQGLKFTKLTINPNEAQSLETRKHQVIEICRFYGVPPHMVMDLERATFSNIEHQDLSFVKYSLQPYLVCWEQEILKSLFRPSERREHFSEFSVEGLLRGDSKARAEFYTAMFNIGVYSQNDIRAKENDNPFEGGDNHYVPMNMVAIEAAQQEQQELPEPPDGDRQARQEQRKRAVQQRNADLKLKTANTYKRIFIDAAERVVKREAKDIRQKAKKDLAERSQPEFLSWLEEYYRNAPEWMKRTMMPVLLSYAEAIQALAADEVSAAAGMTPELEKWMDGYADIWARDYTASSLGQIQAVIRKANEEGLEPLEEIEARLNEWEERRPEKVAGKEIIEAAGVVSKFVYAAAGVRYLRWVNAGGKTCPYCQELNGKRVGIDQAFVGKNDRLDSEDGQMEIRKPALTPPLHQGCQCQIVPD